MIYFFCYLIVAGLVFFVLPFGVSFFIFELGFIPSVFIGLVGGALILQILDVAGMGLIKMFKRNRKAPKAKSKDD